MEKLIETASKNRLVTMWKTEKNEILQKKSDNEWLIQ